MDQPGARLALLLFLFKILFIMHSRVISSHNLLKSLCQIQWILKARLNDFNGLSKIKRNHGENL